MAQQSKFGLGHLNVEVTRSYIDRQTDIRTQTHTFNRWSAHCRGYSLHNTQKNNTQTSMLSAEFNPTILSMKQQQTAADPHHKTWVTITVCFQLCWTPPKCLNNGWPTRRHLLYYILLNMLQTLIRPSSGASEYLLCCVGWLEACWCYVAGLSVGDVVSKCRLNHWTSETCWAIYNKASVI